jgi:hypothetical protein
MTEKDNQLFCDKCNRAVDETFNVRLGSIMSFELCDKCERDLELIVIDFIHGVKE